MTQFSCSANPVWYLLLQGEPFWVQPDQKKTKNYLYLPRLSLLSLCSIILASAITSPEPRQICPSSPHIQPTTRPSLTFSTLSFPSNPPLSLLSSPGCALHTCHLTTEITPSSCELPPPPITPATQHKFPSKGICLAASLRLHLRSRSLSCLPTLPTKYPV